MTYLLPTRTPAKYHIDQLVTFTDGDNRQRSGMIIGVEYFAPNTSPAEDWGEGWHYTIHDPSDDSSSTYHISEACVWGEEQPLYCIALPSGWTVPKYQFLQPVRIIEGWAGMVRGMFGQVIGLNYHPQTHHWSYEIEIDPNSPMAQFYESGDTEMVRENNLEPLPQEACHG